MTDVRCDAAHEDDPTPCEGNPQVVKVLDMSGAAMTGCVHHAARLYASLINPRVHPMPGHDGEALEVYNRAKEIEPFPWIKERKQT